MKSLTTYLVPLLIWPMTCIAVQREVPFQVIDARSHQPIVESVVMLSTFACDISYEENHQELFISCAESDKHGIVRFDFSRVVDGQYVLHIPGYIFSRFSYSAESSQLRLTNSVAGNIRVVRLNPHGGAIRGNSLYDLETGTEYFFDPDGSVDTTLFEQVVIEMKKIDSLTNGRQLLLR